MVSQWCTYCRSNVFQYAYLNGSFFLQTGFGIRWQDVSNEVLDQQVQKDLYDATGTLAHMTYDFTNRVDKARAFYIQVPFYVGAYVRGAYILIGPKFTMPMFTSTQLDLIATSTARYDGFIGPIEEMDNHGIRKDVPLTPNQKQGKITYRHLKQHQQIYQLFKSNKVERKNKCKKHTKKQY